MDTVACLYFSHGPLPPIDAWLSGSGADGHCTVVPSTLCVLRDQHGGDSALIQCIVLLLKVCYAMSVMPWTCRDYVLHGILVLSAVAE